MPQSGHIFRALIASPSDCAHERKIIPEVIAAWNAVHSYDRAAIIEPVLWETHSRPAFGDRPQEIVNQQIVENCDLVIGAFWTRLGTPTGKAESGTAEEIEQFRSSGKPVLLYFSSVPAVQDSVDHDQYKALVEYRDSLHESGLYWRYDSLADFRELLQRHLASHMIELLSKMGNVSAGQGSEVSQEESSPELAGLNEFISQYESFLRRIESEWEAERDSDPYSTDDGKFILDNASNELVHFKSMITQDDVGIATKFSDILKAIRGLQRHQTYMDGGESFRKFWEEGNAVLESLHSIGKKIRSVRDEAQQSVAGDI